MVTIAFLGLGNMGGPMAKNLLAAGLALTVFDLVEAACAAIAAEGASIAASAAEAAEGATVIISMLPAGKHVAGTFLGEDGLLAKVSTDTLILDASTIDDPIVSYRRWYSNDFGADPNNDVMPIEISNNGGSSWTLLENVTENAGVWVYREFTISDYVTPSSNMQLRFIAGDLNAGSVVEAGIDELRVGSISCKNAPEPPSNDDCSNVLNKTF